MRTAFIEELCLLAESNPNLWLVCGDLGYGVLERFAGRFPDRFLNAGVAEQNMTGIAAGLAMSGKTVFTYSIANFPVMRCLEQIRNDVCYHNLDVKIVAVGGGLAYGQHGYTHHGIEDFAVTGALPNLTVAAPGDPVEARAVTRLAAHTPGPVYIRLGKAGEPQLHPSAIDLRLGRTLKIRTGSDLTLLSTGAMLESALQVADLLRREGISTALLSVPYLIPFDQTAILEAARLTPALLTIEEHGWGGLGTRTAEVLAAHRCAVHFRPMRLRSQPVKVAGSQEFLREQHGLGVDAILEAARSLYRAAHSLHFAAQA
jgi:transketolase